MYDEIDCDSKRDKSANEIASNIDGNAGIVNISSTSKENPLSHEHLLKII